MTMTSQVIEECGCVSAMMRFTQQQLKRANYTICGNQTDDDGKFPTSPIRCFLPARRYASAGYCILFHILLM